MCWNARWYGVRRGFAVRWTAVLVMAVAACTGQPPSNPPGPVEAVAQLSAIKLLTLAWTGGEGAERFRLSIRAGGQTTVMVDDMPSSESEYEQEVFLPGQLDVHYLVEACNSGGCVPSQFLEVQRAALDTAIGYIKAPVPGSDDRFGSAVALSADGRVLAIGAPREDGGGAGVDPPADETMSDSGAVYIYTRTAAGVWSGPVYLKSPVPGVDDQFGSALALSSDGSTLAVAASGEAGSGEGIDPPHNDDLVDAGAVYLYELSNSGSWGAPTYFKAPDVSSFDLFGGSLALSGTGDVLAVGVPYEDGGGSGIGPPIDEMAANSGAVVVFERSAGGVWFQTAYIKARHSDAGDTFGYAVALSSDGRVLAVGGTGEDGSGTGADATADNVGTDTGAVWVYGRDDTGQWEFDDYLKASNTGTDDYFGSSVALSADGTALAIGAPSEDGSGTHVNPTSNDAAPDTGAVYVFTRANGEPWSEPTYVKPNGPAPNSLFGYRVAWSGDGALLAIAGMNESGGGSGIQPPPAGPATSSGAIWLYELLAPGEWSGGVRVKASNTGSNDAFGFSMALAQDSSALAVGAFGEDGAEAGIGGDQNDNTLGESGAVYLY